MFQGQPELEKTSEGHGASGIGRNLKRISKELEAKILEVRVKTPEDSILSGEVGVKGKPVKIAQRPRVHMHEMYGVWLSQTSGCNQVVKVFSLEIDQNTLSLE